MRAASVTNISSMKMSRMERYIYLFIISLVLFGCTRKQSSSLPFGLKVNETIRVNYLTEPPSLDWSKSTDTTSSFIQTNIMDGLVQFDFDAPTLKVKPALASSWEHENNTVWTFKLRDDVKWSDGTPLVASHFVDGWERLLRPTTASEYAYYLFVIKGAKDYNSSKIKDFGTVGVQAVDDHTLKVTLDKSISYFPLMLTHHTTYPIRLDVIESHGEDVWADEGKIVTLGAYRLSKWQHDNLIHLERNEEYYDEKAKTKNILVYMVAEHSTAVSLFDTGKLDFQSEVPKSEIRAIRQRPEYRNLSNFGVYYYGFNTEHELLSDKRVRRAIAMSINRAEITEVMGGGELPTTNIIPKGLIGYNENIGIKFDPEGAKKLLADSDIDLTGKKILFHFNTNENHKLIAENVQAQLKKNLGLELELKNEEWKVYLQTLKAGNFDIFRMGWISDYPDPHDFMSLMLSYSDNNRTKWKNSTYDEKVTEASSESDEQKRITIYNEAQKILLEDEVPILPLYIYNTNILISNRLKDFPENEMRQFPMKGVSIVAE